jgi:hypothetical protein
MAQSFDIFGAQFAEFAAPSGDSGFGDVVLSRDVHDRRQASFAQDFDDLTFREINFLHGVAVRAGWRQVENWKKPCTMLSMPRSNTSLTMKVCNRPTH